jgi:hypothetical protein
MEDRAPRDRQASEGQAEFFESIYQRAGGDPAIVPWAAMEPTPYLDRWLQESGPGVGDAIVVACGLGDDAEALAAAGWRVTAFDISTAAIAWCRERFPASPVDYQVQDLSAVPSSWQGAFDLVMEARTIQSFPPETQPQVIGWISALVADPGRLLVSTIGHRGTSAETGPPWPVAEADLSLFLDHGLEQQESVIRPSPWEGFEFFELEYLRR